MEDFSHIWYKKNTRKAHMIWSSNLKNSQIGVTSKRVWRHIMMIKLAVDRPKIKMIQKWKERPHTPLQSIVISYKWLSLAKREIIWLCELKQQNSIYPLLDSFFQSQACKIIFPIKRERKKPIKGRNFVFILY